MRGLWGLRKFFIFLIIFMICFSSVNGFLIVISDSSSSKNGDDRSNGFTRGMVVGPINLINNSYFSQVSDWVLEDAKKPLQRFQHCLVFQHIHLGFLL